MYWLCLDAFSECLRTQAKGTEWCDELKRLTDTLLSKCWWGERSPSHWCEAQRSRQTKHTRTLSLTNNLKFTFSFTLLVYDSMAVLCNVTIVFSQSFIESWNFHDILCDCLFVIHSLFLFALLCSQEPNFRGKHKCS